MPEQEIPQEQFDAPIAPATWKDIVRQHITGPVFSLALHIILLVLLGTLVIIAPNAIKDDVDPVQITEMEPVLPPPEEEPMPSDMTVMDTSSPSLDRYDSSEIERMEEVGVTDVQVMTDIDIPTPLTIPDSNSALKLQGVLPFGRPGGGGEMGDGGEGDGRGNLKGMLQGVFYDLKQTSARRPTDAMGDPNSDHDYTRGRIVPIVRKFIQGTWRREYDNQGRVHYPDLDSYYCSPTRLWNSCFYVPSQIYAKDAPSAFQCDKDVNPGGWICIYSGNVVAPFSGKFRFVGFGDDVLLVRFNKTIVFEYGWYSFLLEERFNNYNDWTRFFNSDSNRRKISDSGFYSKHKLDVYHTGFDQHGIAKGVTIEVQEGQVYPIEILISEIPGDKFNMMLFVEQLDEDGRAPESSPEAFTLFRTTLDMPDQPQGDFLRQARNNQGLIYSPPFKPYGPVWRVVRSATASSGGFGGGSGSLIGSRTQPRTARVTEDDEDLSL